jgi:hypothetical protein
MLFDLNIGLGQATWFVSLLALSHVCKVSFVCSLTLMLARDGNSARGRGYPRILDPTGTGSKIRPRARVRASKSARGWLTGWNLYPRAYPPPASK